MRRRPRKGGRGDTRLGQDGGAGADAGHPAAGAPAVGAESGRAAAEAGGAAAGPRRARRGAPRASRRPRARRAPAPPAAPPRGAARRWGRGCARALRRRRWSPWPKPLAEGRKHLCLTDPDARMMGGGRERKVRECHSFEVAVDREAGLLVAAQASQERQ